MDDPFEFADLLNQYVDRSGYTPGQLSKLTDIPKATIVNWLEYRVKRPRSWRDLVKLLAVLHTSEPEATQVLQSAGHPSIEELSALAREEQDRDLLSPWADEIRKRREEAPFQIL